MEATVEGQGNSSRENVMWDGWREDWSLVLFLHSIPSWHHGMTCMKRTDKVRE